jgi:glycosyltransferase involved in cell wall biosynthesis
MKFEVFLNKLNRETLRFFSALNQDRLKIGIISYYFEPPSISGVGVHARLLAEFLVKQGCEVHVFCSGSEDEIYSKNKVIIHTISRNIPNTEGSSSKKRLEYYLFESEVVKDFIRENNKRRFNIIHTHGSLTKAAFILKKVTNVKWIHTFHAIEIARMKKLSKEEKYYTDLISWIESTVNYCDAAIYVSRPIYIQGKKRYHIKKSIVIPNGVDTELFSNCSIRNKNVLFIGRFSKEKGIELFPEIIAKVISIEDATITLVTPYNTMPKDLKEVQDKIKRLEEKYPERIKIITKPLNQEDLAELYKNCQVYIQPSKYESFGLCIIEAMSTGRPVVAFKVGGIPKLVGNCGFVVNNKNDMLTKIEELLTNLKLCEETGIKSRNEAEKYNWSIIAKKTIDFYKVVLNE